MPTRDPKAALTPARLGGRVAAARAAVGLTQQQAADRLGIGQTTYAAREAATTLPYGALLELVRVLGYDPAILCPELAGRR